MVAKEICNLSKQHEQIILENHVSVLWNSSRKNKYWQIHILKERLFTHAKYWNLYKMLTLKNEFNENELHGLPCVFVANLTVSGSNKVWYVCSVISFFHAY